MQPQKKVAEGEEPSVLQSYFTSTLILIVYWTISNRRLIKSPWKTVPVHLFNFAEEDRFSGSSHMRGSPEATTISDAKGISLQCYSFSSLIPERFPFMGRLKSQIRKQQFWKCFDVPHPCKKSNQSDFCPICLFVCVCCTRHNFRFPSEYGFLMVHDYLS